MKNLTLALALTLALSACAGHSSAPPVGKGGICATQPDSEKCNTGIVGGHGNQ